MLHRLRQIDYENSGLLTLDSLVSIADKYGIKLTSQDVSLIKEKYRRQVQPGHASKIDYMRVLNDIQMQLTPEGGFQWAFSSGSSRASPYRVTISKMAPSDDILTIMSSNKASPKSNNKHQRNGSLRIKTMRQFNSSTLNSTMFTPRLESEQSFDFFMMSPKE